MKPEDYPEDYVVYSGCDTPIKPSRSSELFEDNLRLNQQLQAEKARADKAEEMVAVFRKEAKFLDSLLRDTYSDIEFFWTEDDGEPTRLCKQRMTTLSNARARLEPIVTTTEQTAQAHNKRLCDEICGKIKDMARNYHHVISAEKAIDIVKSVLGGEG